MGVIKRHSFDSKKIRRYEIGKLIDNNRIINIRTEIMIGSYFNAIGNGAIFDYDPYIGNVFFARIDQQVANSVGSFIENRRLKS